MQLTKQAINQIDSAIHHIFLALYCMGENDMVENVLSSLDKLGIAAHGVHVAEKLEEAFAQSTDQVLSQFILSYWNSENTLHSIQAIYEICKTGELNTNWDL